MNCLYYHDLKLLQKYPRFNTATWKFELSLLWGGKIFAKRRQFCWCDLIIWPAPKTFPKKKVVLLKWFDNLNCAYYHGLNFLKNKVELHEILNCPVQTWKYPRCNEVIWKFELHPLLRGVIFSKIRQFRCHLKISPSIIKTTWNFQ